MPDEKNDQLNNLKKILSEVDAGARDEAGLAAQPSLPSGGLTPEVEAVVEGIPKHKIAAVLDILQEKDEEWLSLDEVEPLLKALLAKTA